MKNPQPPKQKSMSDSLLESKTGLAFLALFLIFAAVYWPNRTYFGSTNFLCDLPEALIVLSLFGLATWQTYKYVMKKLEPEV